MARPESVALAGYFPTPEHLLERIARLVDTTNRLVLLDPCAGDGTAALKLAKVWGEHYPCLFTCEMEGKRHQVLRKKLANDYSSRERLLHGDAFRASFTRSKDSPHGISCLFLNPPYDTDRDHGRLEQKFLDRFTATLIDDGVLLFLVPHYALAASAETLGREYRNLHCFRFPDVDFEAYKQVVLVASKQQALDEPSAKVVSQVQAWARDASTIPELPQGEFEPVVQLPHSTYNNGLSNWRMHNVDATTLRSKIQPWMQSLRKGTLTPVTSVMPDLPVQELLLRTYPVATPPRPAHIAAGIASGLFNGAHIEPDLASSGLPNLLIKGVFDREYITVEQKHDSEGKVIGEYRVQQPKLVTTVLNLRTRQYHQLVEGTNPTGTLNVEEMTVADLLRHYGIALMAAMERQCPVLYNPKTDGDSVALAESPRNLFKAQAHSSKALVKLLGGPDVPMKSRRGRAAILLGEIGSGKSTVALITAVTCGAKRILALCPPHLLTSWTNEIEAVLPDAEIRTLSCIADVDAIAEMDTDKVVVSLLSRESAKLSHNWEGVGDSCPKCGGALSQGPAAQAKGRLRCGLRPPVPANKAAEWCQSLAIRLAPFLPAHDDVQDILLSRHLTRKFVRRHLQHYYDNMADGPEEGEPFVDLFGGLKLAPTAWDRIQSDNPELEGSKPNPRLAWVDEILDHLVTLSSVHSGQALQLLLLAVNDEERIERVARQLLAQGSSDGRQIMLMLDPGGKRQLAVFEDYQYNRGSWDRRNELQGELDKLLAGESLRGGQLTWERRADPNEPWGTMSLHGKPAGSVAAAGEALHKLRLLAEYHRGSTCGEPLFQASGHRRVALASYIKRRHPTLVDFLILDEGHEYATETSAQSRAGHRLTGLKLPTLLMTGTIMNGYASSLFINMWFLSADFRAEFARNERGRFVDRYGYRKVLLEDKEEGQVVEFGSSSDRVVRSERQAGDAPGILPLFVIRHLLRLSVTLHKADLAIDLPECTQQMFSIEPETTQLARYLDMEDALLTRIKEDMFTPLAGKLFGQLAELPSYLDRATLGNTTSGQAFEVRYPEAAGDGLVVSQPTFPEEIILPKEAWMLDRIESELAEDRNVMVFAWHTAVLPRLAKIIEARIQEPVVLLDAGKVNTKKRQNWITKNVIKPGVRVLVANPVAVQTGLNNLVHFSTEIWMENPACNPITYRQATGRVDRIGAKKETRILFPVYAQTLQGTLYDLLMRKVAVSVSTDGLDPESALRAAGVGSEDYLAGLSIGKQIWAMLQGQGEPEEDRILLDTLTARNRAMLDALTDPD